MLPFLGLSSVLPNSPQFEDTNSKRRNSTSSPGVLPGLFTAKLLAMGHLLFSWEARAHQDETPPE